MPRTTNGVFPICTKSYRAPELYYADPKFGIAIDIWALGISAAAMAGYCFPAKLEKIVEPTTADFEKVVSRFLAAPSWPAHVVSFGEEFFQFLFAALERNHVNRNSAGKLLELDYFHPERFPLGGVVAAEPRCSNVAPMKKKPSSEVSEAPLASASPDSAPTASAPRNPAPASGPFFFPRELSPMVLSSKCDGSRVLGLPARR